MANQDASASHYINTMVFSVVAGIISSMLLLLVMQGSDTVKQFSVLVITIEVGVVLIILAAIYQIIAYERRRFKQAIDGTMNMMTVKSCPDYWTLYDGKKCKNTHQLFEANDDGLYTKYVIHGNSTDTNTKDRTERSVNLSDYSKVSVRDACTKKFDNLPNHPWTDLSAVCNSFHMST